MQFLEVASDGPVTIITLNREARRNAIGDPMLAEIEEVFDHPPEGTRCFVLVPRGNHFCAGLDLAEHHDLNRSPIEFMRMSRNWHRVFDKMQFGGIPVVAAMPGGVIGGGLELAGATHVRIADETTFFALPEGQRGIFTAGGATVRVARIIGSGRMIDLMLSGRTLDVQRGYELGLVHEIAPKGETIRVALETAKRIAENPPMTNYAIVAGINRIDNMASGEGLFAESLLAAVVQMNPDIQERLAAFLNKKTKRLEIED